MVTEAFKPGDIVHLKSGGPSMTVCTVMQVNDARGPVLDCAWFEGRKEKRSSFFAVAIAPGEGGDRRKPADVPRASPAKIFYTETDEDRA